MTSPRVPPTYVFQDDNFRDDTMTYQVVASPNPDGTWQLAIGQAGAKLARVDWHAVRVDVLDNEFQLRASNGTVVTFVPSGVAGHYSARLGSHRLNEIDDARVNHLEDGRVAVGRRPDWQRPNAHLDQPLPPQAPFLSEAN